MLSEDNIFLKYTFRVFTTKSPKIFELSALFV